MEKTLRQKLYDKVGGKGSTWNTEVNPKGLVSLACIGVIAGVGSGCATSGFGNINYQNTDRATETNSETKMWSGNVLYPRTIRNKEYAIKVAPENKIAKVLNINMDVINNRYLIPIDNERTEETLKPSNATIENKGTRYFLVPVEEDNKGTLRIIKGKHDQSDMILKERKNICLNELAEYKKESDYVSQRNIKRKIRDFPMLNHGKEDFTVFEIENNYITEKDIKSLGFGNNYKFGEDVLPIVFVRGNLTPELKIKHKGNRKVDLTEKLYGKQFLLIKGEMIEKPANWPPEGAEQGNKVVGH